MIENNFPLVRSRENKMASTLSTKNGKIKVAHNGFMYTYDGKSKDGAKKFWRCDKRHLYLCKARLHTDLTGGTVLLNMHEHNHGSDIVRVHVEKVKNTVKRRAIETLEV